MPEIYKERILKLLKHQDYEPVKINRLAQNLGVGPEDYPQFKEAFDQLRGAGHVIIGHGNLVTLPALTGRIVGRFRANPRGFGFITTLEPTAHGDLFVPPDATADAMTGDIVMAKVVKKGRRAGQSRLVGEIVQILERACDRCVGTLSQHPEGWLVQPDGNAFVEPIAVDDVAAKGAREKDKVVVEITSYPTEKYIARGVIVQVLGRAGHYDTEVLSVVQRFHLPTEFDAECLNQARTAAHAFKPESITDRENISSKTIITIDPPDAKDFDDAISLERTADGKWLLGVHIADVSGFVSPDSPLDIEARKRGNSIYLPAKTIPMLPEVLSNGVCSLQPDQARLAKSAYITYDDRGKVVTTRFANSIIRSTQRLTYLQADAALRGHTKDLPPQVIKLLKDMEQLSRIIEARRRDQGMIHLDLPETELVMDDAGRVTDARPADTSYPHTIIEMFMVEANEAVARLIDRLDIPFLRRIHPEPDALTLRNLAMLVRSFGLTLPRTPSRQSIQNLLAAVKDADASLAVNLAVLRSFEKARYASQHIGHYALASTHYCHFTSPIRRYADLTVHRILDFYIRGRTDRAKQIAAGQNLAEIGSHISFTEQRATDAERELTTVLVLQLLGKRIGSKIRGVVTGVTSFGVFLQCRKFGVEGLVQLSDLGPDEWKYDARSQCVVGRRSNKTVRLGQAMDVTITSVDVPARKLNFTPIEPLVTAEQIRRAGPSVPREPKPGKQSAAKDTSRRHSGKGPRPRKRNTRPRR